MRGEVFGKPDLSPNQVPAGQQGGDDRGGRGGDRGPRRDGDRNDRGPRRDGDRGPRRDGAAGGPRGGQGGGNRGGQGGGPAGGGNRGGQGYGSLLIFFKFSFFTQMLQPKRTKYRKMQKGRVTGLAYRGSSIDFGSFALKSLEISWITARQIEAARIAMTRAMKREGQ
nr:ribosomal protein L16, chloroplastic [Tanacetum cinerariifolium]